MPTVLFRGDDPPEPPAVAGPGGRPPGTPRSRWPGGTTPGDPRSHFARTEPVSTRLPAARPVGPSGLTIPRVALGCGSFGGVGSAPEFFGRGLTEDQAFELMDAAWEFGITHFDTADAYGGGRSEQAIGRWITARGVRPQLTTKTFNPMEAGADSGLKPERIR